MKSKDFVTVDGKTYYLGDVLIAPWFYDRTITNLATKNYQYSLRKTLSTAREFGTDSLSSLKNWEVKPKV